MAVLVVVRMSMIGGFCSAILSAVIGYGMAKVVWHAPKLERVVNIISLGCCIIPVVIISYYEQRTWILTRFFGLYQWFVLLAVLGWRLPYRLMKKSRANVIGIVCLSMARAIALDDGITFAVWISDIFSAFGPDNLWSYLLSDIPYNLVMVIIVICLLNVGRYFLYPRSTKEIFIDML